MSSRLPLRKTKVQGEFLWTIESWKTAAKLDKLDSIESCIFSINKFDLEFKWQLRMFPQASPKEIEINLVTYNKQTVQTSFKIFFLNARNQKTCQSGVQDFLFSRKNYTKEVKFNTTSVASLLDRDELRILCELTISVTSTVIQNPTLEVPAAAPSTVECSKRLKQFDDFEKLVNNKLYSDVTFKIGRRQIFSHKVILAAKSHVFASMFETNPAGNFVIKVQDLKYDVLMEMLRFMYTAKVNGIEGIAAELLTAANEYCIEDLKSECEVVLSNNVNINNVLPLLDMSVVHNALVLKTKALKFISCNKKLVVNLQKFKTLATNSSIMLEICQALANTD